MVVPLHYAPQCSSTSDLVLDFITPPTTPVAVYSFHQTAGRGQYGNRWDNGVGQNLAYSLAWPLQDVDLPPEWLNFKIALDFAEIVGAMCERKLHIKWPNDLILNGKKIAGQLLELKKVAGQAYYIVGFGLNVNQNNFAHLPQASSMALETHETYDLHKLTQVLHYQIQRRLSQKSSLQSLQNALQQVLFRRDEISLFRLENIIKEGQIVGIAPDGKLLVNFEGKIESFAHKTIEMLY
jgi:BirA family transcriptional regulator, biotin operon repressor / biotin---[acetyl-CoA-carboxylase] ligase